MSISPLVDVLSRFAAAPHDGLAARAAESALLAVTDPDELDAALVQFPAELEVALAVEARLEALGGTHPDALSRIARVRAAHADDKASWERALALTQRVLNVAPDNAIALETGILLFAFVPTAPRSLLDAWSQRYVSLCPHDLRALSARTKVLLKFGDTPAAVSFLREQIVACEQAGEHGTATSLTELLRDVLSGADVLRQWP